MSFSSYYIWFLIDNFGFYKNEKELFTEFTENLMKERRKVITENNKVLVEFCKNCLNGAYGKDTMNTANYNRLSILSKIVSCRKITNNAYLVEKHIRTYEVKTAVYAFYIR
jgi:hypothetical protein